MSINPNSFPIPEAFPDILHDYIREVIRAKPKDIIEFSVEYFKSLEEKNPNKPNGIPKLEINDSNKVNNKDTVLYSPINKDVSLPNDSQQEGLNHNTIKEMKSEGSHSKLNSATKEFIDDVFDKANEQCREESEKGRLKDGTNETFGVKNTNEFVPDGGDNQLDHGSAEE